MNYIKLINAFWEVRRERADFDPYVITLYFALVDIANRRDWKPFTAYREDIIALSGMSAKPYYKAREILKESGLIDFQEGSSKKIMCSFIIKQPLPQVTVATTVRPIVQPTVAPTVATTEATTILNKPINLETYKPINTHNGSEEILEAKVIPITETPKPPTLLEMFEHCYKLYGGTKREPETEFQDLKARYGSSLNRKFFVALFAGIQDKIKANTEASKNGGFTPKWPSLKNYLYNKQWEEKAPAEAKPTTGKDYKTRIEEQYKKQYA